MRRGSAQTVRLAPKKRLPPQLELPGGDRFTLRRLLIRASGPGQPHDEDGQGGTPEDRTENQHRGREQASVGTVIVTMLLLRHAANVVVLSLV